MPYGRTVLELVTAQALILATFLVTPIDLVALVGPVSAILMTTAFAATAAPVLYSRHRQRIADRDFGRKIDILRSSAA